MIKALQTEIDTLNAHQVFAQPQWKPKGRKPIQLKVIFKAKWKSNRDGEPIFDKWKARIVARGFTAIEGIDYDPNRVSSPVGRASSYLILLAESAAKGMKLFYFDIKAAHLLSPTHEEIWVQFHYQP